MGDSLRISCEFFPCRTTLAQEKLRLVRKALSALGCEYYSVTHGTGGRTDDQTFELVEQIRNEDKRPVMPHITCVASKQQELTDLLLTYRKVGIRSFLALRGDPPLDAKTESEVPNALALVKLIREVLGKRAHITVAVYPEQHPKSPSLEADLHCFRQKFESGANEAITQYFFNTDAFSRFMDDVMRLNIPIPIIPGVMPITNYPRLMKFSQMCGTQIPRWIQVRLERYQDDPQSLFEFGADVVASLCQRLIDDGVQGLHFYSLNRADAMLAIGKRLGWGESV